MCHREFLCRKPSKNPIVRYCPPVYRFDVTRESLLDIRRAHGFPTLKKTAPESPERDQQASVADYYLPVRWPLMARESALKLKLKKRRSANETSSPGGNTGSMTVNALHVKGPSIDFVVASAQSGITCS
jgi:hypothetical protein